MLLGVPKAVLSNLATWIGVSLEIARSEVRVEVTEAEVTELLQLIHTLFGKCMSIASVLYIWGPLLQELYAALICSSWTKQGPQQLHLDQTGQTHPVVASGSSAR